MKKDISLSGWCLRLAAGVLLPGCLLLFPNSLQAAGSQDAGAAGELKRPAQEFNKAAGANAQQAGKVPYSDVTAGANVQVQAPAQTPADPRNQALTGSPQTGYAGTWTDPATGDTITSVIAPTPPPGQNNFQSWPIVVAPDVSSDGYSGWGGNGNYGDQNSWPQWPDNPGNPGYGPPLPYPPQHGYQPPYPPQHGYMPMPPFPGNFHPGYRPLQPNPPRPPHAGGNWQPGAGMPPMRPGGWPNQPSAPGSGWGQPGNVPPAQNPGSIWQPQQPGQTPGSGSNPPGWKPLPMAPAGTQWGNSGINPGPGRAGMFGDTRRGGGF